MKRPEDLTFEEYQFYPVYCMVRGFRYVDRRLVEMRDYIIEHFDEDITPHSVIDTYGMPYNNTRYRFHSIMGESMEHMIRRLRETRAAGTEQTIS